MRTQTVAVFPGQGAYAPGALAGFADRPAVTDVLSTVDDVGAGYGVGPVSPLLLGPGAPGIDALTRDDPDRLAVAIFAAATAAHTLLPEPADVLLGHSMGEIAALTAAGAFTVADGARVVCLRNAALRARTPPKGGLAAIALPVGKVEHLLAAGDFGLSVAAVNSPRQTVVSGPDDELAHLARVAEALGTPVTRLRSPYSYHHNSCAPAAQLFAESLEKITVRPMTTRVCSGMDTRCYADSESARAALPSHLTRRVRFFDAVLHLYSHGADAFVECGPGGTLSTLVRGTLAGVTTRTALDSAQLPQPPAPTQAPPPPVPVAAPVRPDVDRERLVLELCTSYAQRLGYPEEVFTEEADLEADLGVDSLKRTELLRWTAERYQLGAVPDGLRVDDYPTVSTIADYVLAARGAHA